MSLHPFRFGVSLTPSGSRSDWLAAREADIGNETIFSLR
jgi:hypothetical protein